MAYRIFLIILLLPCWALAKRDTTIVDILTSGDFLPHEVFVDYDYSDGNNEQPDFLFQNSGSPFLNLLSKFNIRNFSPRGLPDKERKVYIEGILWNQPEDGQINFSELSSFSGTTKIQSYNGSATAPDYSGNLNGTTLINVGFDNQPFHVKGMYSFSNGNSRNNIQLDYHSGNLFKSWQINLKTQQQWANEGYLPGTSGYGQTFYAAVQKQIHLRHALSLTFFGNDYQRTFGSALTQETATIAGSYFYNPNWGWQNGSKRNENTLKSFLPAGILKYEGQVSATTLISSGISWQKGYTKFGVVDWFKAYNPHPDYYQNLPSYYYLMDDLRSRQTGDMLTEIWKNQPYQTDWDGFYEANRLHGNSISGFSQSALYVVSSDKEEINRLRFSTTLKRKLNKDMNVHLGLQINQSAVRHFRELKDLLGGAYFVNLNQFAFQSYGQPLPWEQYDLIHPNRQVREGERYFYDYQSKTSEEWVWGKFNFIRKQVQVHLTGLIQKTGYQRTGFYQNGLFPDHSLGKSPKEIFYTPLGQIDFLFRPGKHHLFWVNGQYENQAPGFNSIFFDPRIRESTTPGIQPEIRRGFEFGWQWRGKSISLELTGYSSERKNHTEVLQFYHEDYETFVHYVMTGINTRQTGLELAATWALLSFLNLHLLGSWQQAFYSSRPQVSIFRDNDTATILRQETVFWKNYVSIQGPQTVLGVGLTLYQKRLGQLLVSGVWHDRNFVSLNPTRFTETAVYLLPSSDPKWPAILYQEKLPGYFLIHLSAQKRFKIRKKQTGKWGQSNWTLFASVQNLLDKKGYILTGSEQLRFDFDHKEPAAFPNKYRFGYGRTFSVGIRWEISGAKPYQNQAKQPSD